MSRTRIAPSACVQVEELMGNEAQSVKAYDIALQLIEMVEHFNSNGTPLKTLLAGLAIAHGTFQASGGGAYAAFTAAVAAIHAGELGPQTESIHVC